MKRFIHRLLNVIRPRHGDEDLTREFRSHLALLADEHQRRGLSPDEARLAARRAMGSVALAQDLHRDARSFVWLDDLRRDARHALRRLRQAPGFAAVAILTLGLGIGIGVNNTFFTIVNAICLRGLPIESPERVLSLGTRDAQGRNSNLSYAEFEALRSVQRSFAGVAVYANAPVTIAEEGRAPDRVMGAHISTAGFDLLGQVPILGRGFRADDDRAGATRWRPEIGLRIALGEQPRGVAWMVLRQALTAAWDWYGCWRRLHVCLRPGVHCCARSNRSSQTDRYGGARFCHGDDRECGRRRMRNPRAASHPRRSSRCVADRMKSG
jgi:hypothetical protein